MKNFRRITIIIILLLALFFIGVNVFLFHTDRFQDGRPYRVEVNRIAQELAEDNTKDVNLSQYQYVTGITKLHSDYADWDKGEHDYTIREINGDLYRFDYVATQTDKDKMILTVNLILGIMSAIIIGVLLYIRVKILAPFDQLKELPYELSRGNLTTPVKESKNRFFGRFLWGVDLLREHMEEQKRRELQLQKDKKTLLLSLSHDIKTPLSAIKLYSKALSKGLYPDREKQLEIAENIDNKANEIEDFIARIIEASSEDFLDLDVNNTEFYLSALIDNLCLYYNEKLSLIHTDFAVGDFCDCLLKGDIDRSIEVLQNIMENAIKYGDGTRIRITFSEEDDCQLITIENSGCTLPDTELPHIFDSFWRGSNSTHKSGSGLGLYICRQIMHKMNGDIFAEIRDGNMYMTLVFTKA